MNATIRDRDYRLVAAPRPRHARIALQHMYAPQRARGAQQLCTQRVAEVERDRGVRAVGGGGFGTGGAVAVTPGRR